MKIKNFLAALTLFVGVTSFAQVPANDELFLQMKKADSLLFELGFNQCNIKVLESIVHHDLRFLHDQGGIQNRAEFFAAVRKNICPETGEKPTRKLVAGSLEVYPLYTNGKLYGAIQMGVHEFYRPKDGALYKTSTAKFNHTWLLTDGKWMLFGVLSYDHQSPKE